jgi:hypothetical protein
MRTLYNECPYIKMEVGLSFSVMLTSLLTLTARAPPVHNVD